MEDFSWNGCSDCVLVGPSHLFPPSPSDRQVHLDFAFLVLGENVGVNAVFANEATRRSSRDARSLVHDLPEERTNVAVPLAGGFVNQTSVGEAEITIRLPIRVVADHPH